jgi:hypothetical protein
MQMPSVVKLKLIFFASSKVFPVAPVFEILSLPAKSTKLSFAYFFEPSGFVYVYSSSKIVWLLELLSF